MTDQVIVEIHDNTTIEELRAALPNHITVEERNEDDFIATVQEARDAEEEVTAFLDKAGIDCYVYHA